MRYTGFALFILFILCVDTASAQPDHGIRWAEDGNSFYEANEGTIVQTMLPSFSQKTIVTAQQLTPAGRGTALPVDNFLFFRRMTKKY